MEARALVGRYKHSLLLSCLGLLANAACSVSLGTVSSAGLVSISPTTDRGGEVVLDPVSIGVGYHQAYALTVHDAKGKLLPNATGAFRISPEGSCRANVCTAYIRGVHTVIATSGGLTAYAYLNVTPGGFARLGIVPRLPQITAGSPFTFTAANVNSYGDPISDVTAEATFSISNEGSCAANICTAFRAHGGQLLTVNQAGHTSHFVLQVMAGKMTNISIEPSNATVVAGFHETYSATGYDAYDNAVENAYGMTNFAGAAKAIFTITPDGSCVHATCSPSSVGAHRVTLIYSGLNTSTTLTAVS